MKLTDFKIGDTIKLKDYTKHSDWKTHTNQEGIIYEVDKAIGYCFGIRWEDKSTSSAPLDNLISPKVTNWRAKIEKQI